MNKKFILPISLILLVGLAVFVSATQNWFYNVGDSQNDYQLTIEVKEGWNLLQGFHPNFISAGSQVNAGNIKAVFMYSPDKNKYFEIYPENKLQNSGLDQNDEYYDDNAGLYSYWVYVDNLQTCNDPACEIPGGKLNKLVYTIHLIDLNNIQLKKGWNFVGINPNMYKGEYNPNEGKEGEYFSWDAIKGDCVYEKIYAWNYETQTWFTSMTSDLQIKSYDFDDFLGIGMLVKVSNACTLKKSSVNGGGSVSPPQVPQ
jgi:hypothetical protein